METREDKVTNALEYVHNFCKVNRCERCFLKDSLGGCKLSPKTPAFWDMEDIKDGRPEKY